MGNCEEDGTPCMTHELWISLNQKIHDYLVSVNLADLVKQQKGAEHALSAANNVRPLRRTRGNSMTSVAA
jgi:Rrf2 family iron-sulfur cluster assembly transcriptional regulator